MNPNQQYSTGAGMQTPGQFVGQAVPQNAGMPPANQTAPKTNPNSTQNTMLISEIRDGIVIMNDGSFRSVIMCKSINFDLMSGQEQEGIEYAFQSFINSLYFPIQIFIRSQEVDLRPYIEKLNKIKSEHENMLLAMLMEDYINFITTISYEANIMDKTFYVVIPFSPTGIDAGEIKKVGKDLLSGIFGNKDQHVVINEADLEKAKTELRNMTQSTISGLAQAGIQSVPLDTQELIELYYDVYNPDTATRQPLKNFDDLSTPVVMRGGGNIQPVQGGGV